MARSAGGGSGRGVKSKSASSAANRWSKRQRAGYSAATAANSRRVATNKARNSTAPATKPRRSAPPRYRTSGGSTSGVGPAVRSFFDIGKFLKGN